MLHALPLSAVIRRFRKFLALAKIDFARIVDARRKVIVADFHVPAVVRRGMAGVEFGSFAHGLPRPPFLRRLLCRMRARFPIVRHPVRGHVREHPGRKGKVVMEECGFDAAGGTDISRRTVKRL
jgi:hypothetical protein